MISLDVFNSIKAGAETNTRIFTPQKIVREMLDTLPPEVWNSKTTFLDPAVKSGVYLVEIFNRLMEVLTDDENFKDESVRRKHILENQLFGIAIDEFDLLVAQRSLYGFIGGESNIRYIDGYMQKVKDKDSKRYIDAVEKEFNNMQFDVVIGNPPYQDASQSIYNRFIDCALELKPEHVVMITKNNWLASDTMKDTRANMISAGIKVIFNYPIAYEVFEEASPSVAFFHIEKNHDGKTRYVEIREGKIHCEYSSRLNVNQIITGNILDAMIIQKIQNSSSTDNFGNHVFPDECFRINSNGMVGRGDNKYFLDEKDTRSDEYNVSVIYMDSSKNPYIRYIKHSDIPSRQEEANKYKVICGSRIRKDGTVISNIRVVNPMTVCTKSWGMLYTSKSMEEIMNVAKYIKSRVFRYLVYLMCDNGLIAISKYRFSLVPLQDFTNQSDIDWSQPIPQIDQQLYKKYNLTDEEIAYIESTIKPM